jgi:hypothetical protein
VPIDQDAYDAAAWDRGFMREHRRVTELDHTSQHTDDVNEDPDQQDPYEQEEE